jgi:hypothetical protein
VSTGHALAFPAAAISFPVPLLRANDLGGQEDAGEALGLGPEPGGGGGVAGSAGRPDGDRRPDQSEGPARTVVAAVDGLGALREVLEVLIAGLLARSPT